MLNAADGTVIGSLQRGDRAIEFKKFLQKIDDQVPEHLDVHLLCDNYGTYKCPTIKRWLTAHPRCHSHDFFNEPRADDTRSRSPTTDNSTTIR